MKELVGLRSPWVILNEKVKAMFAEDGDVNVEYAEKDGRRTLTLRVASARKAQALLRLMPAFYDFGNVRVVVSIVPGNIAHDGMPLPDDANIADVVAAAFEGNPVVTQVRNVSKGLFKDLAYCVFRKEVIQIPVDNLADVNGNESTLMECVAREVLTDAKGVYFCTSAGARGMNGFGDAPLGEWP